MTVAECSQHRLQVSEEALNRVENRIRAINGLAEIKRVQNADVPVDYVMSLGAYDAMTGFQTVRLWNVAPYTFAMT